MSSADTSLTKKPYQKTSYTQDQILEFMKCAHPDTGPRYFMKNYYHIQHPTQGRIKYVPYEYQEKLIDTYHDYRFSVSLLPRQSGKCFTGDTNITIRNKHTGEQKTITAQEFYEMQKASTNDK